MATNRYTANCAGCGSRVPPRGGSLRKIGGRWVVRHPACEGKTASRRKRVHTIRFSTGATMTQNSNGRCIDAPCCGCCD